MFNSRGRPRQRYRAGVASRSRIFPTFTLALRLGCHSLFLIKQNWKIFWWEVTVERQISSTVCACLPHGGYVLFCRMKVKVLFLVKCWKSRLFREADFVYWTIVFLSQKREILPFDQIYLHPLQVFVQIFHIYMINIARLLFYYFFNFGKHVSRKLTCENFKC